MLVATKTDARDDIDEAHITTEAGQEMADEYGMLFYETSAKENIGVSESFLEIAKTVKDKLDK